MSIYTRLHETGTLDDMLSCPYNPSHVMGANRFQAHLIKCRKQHPEKAKVMEICPYNQTHHVYDDDMDKHLSICPQYHHFQRAVVPVMKARKEKEEMEKEEMKRQAAEKQKQGDEDDAVNGGGANKSVPGIFPAQAQPSAEDLAYLAEWS